MRTSPGPGGGEFHVLEAQHLGAAGLVEADRFHGLRHGLSHGMDAPPEKEAGSACRCGTAKAA